MTKPFLQLTTEQADALQKILVWFKSQNGSDPDKPFLTLGGYAGTGKTTLLGQLRLRLAEENKALRISFCAFTGKASQVLQGKLEEQGALLVGDSVSTIHGLIYEAVTDDEGRLLEWKKRKRFPCGLIILDEASMVGKDIWRDLMSFGVPILAVGDHGQLPPVNDTFSLMQEPDLRLEEIHRQAQDSPIIRLSMEIRETGRVPFGTFGSGVAKVRLSDFDLEEVLGAWSMGSAQSRDTLFLTGKNATRVALNRKIRTLIGMEMDHPMGGDRVICLKNNWERSLFNGQLGTIQSLEPHSEPHWYDAKINLDDGATFSGLINRSQFNQPQTVREVPGLRSDMIGDLFDFGYALTVHKAQGSQARRAVVFEERMTRDEDAWRRWLYTAVTRAEEELLIVSMRE